MSGFYWGHDCRRLLWVASEMKALVGVCADVAQFPPGHYFLTDETRMTPYYKRPWRDYTATQGRALPSAELREAFQNARYGD